MTYNRYSGSIAVRLALATAIGLGLAGCGSDDDDDQPNSPTTPITIEKPAKPEGVGEEQVVAVPVTTYPLPALQYAESNVNNDQRFSIADNTVAHLLSGINDVWKGTSDTYQNAGSGDGPDTYLANPIQDEEVWEANMEYVLEVTQNRTDEEAILAFLDDVRSKNYSIIDGYGPLTETYVANSGAYTDVHVPTTAQVLEDEHYLSTWNDNIVFAGDKDSELGEIVTLVDAFRQRSPASTNGSKYIFSTPRPWRMNDSGEVDFLGTDKDYECTDGSGNTETRIVDQYTTNVDVVPGLMCARRPHSQSHHDKGLYTEDTDNRRKDGGYPSGHTNAGYMASWAMAYALPQRFSEMLTRGSELGESRIVAGMHSPLDVISGRVQSTIVASYALNQPHIKEEAMAAYNRAQEFFGDQADIEGMSLYDYAHRTLDNEASMIDGANVRTEVFDNNLYDSHAANKELYRFRMTYGLPQDPEEAGQDPIVPEGAEALLATRQPYLSDEQRRAVLYTTSIDSGYPTLDATNGWGRLDLVTAADGYGAFVGDVNVTMNAGDGSFNARDWWRNDISGEGRLTKAGDGHLTLTGDNTYTGGTLLQGGFLEAESTTAFGTGDLYIEDGTLVVDADGSLSLGGNFTQDAGTLVLHMESDSSQITVNNVIYIDGGKLTLDFSDFTPQSGAELTLISGDSVTGTFDSVEAGEIKVDLSYSDTSITVTVE